MIRKFIIIFVLLGLLLNIMHDFVVLEKSTEHCKSSIQLTIKSINDSCCSKSMELHKIFHFVAILTMLEIPFIPSSWVVFAQEHRLFDLLSYQHFVPPKS